MNEDSICVHLESAQVQGGELKSGRIMSSMVQICKICRIHKGEMRNLLKVIL